MALISMIPSQTGGGTDPYSSWFGTGEDGDVTISTDTPIAVGLDEGQIIKQYNNLTITEDGVLHPANRCNGMILLIKGDLTVNGTIHADKCAPLLNTNEESAVQEQHIVLCGALTGGSGGSAGAHSDDDDRIDVSGAGVGGAGFYFGGGFGGGSGGNSSTNYAFGKGANGDPRPPVGTAIPYPAPTDQNVAAMYGAGGGSRHSYGSAYGGGGPGGSGGVTFYGSPSLAKQNGQTGDALGGGGVWIFVQGKVRIGGAGKISAAGGNGAQGAYVRQPSGSNNKGWNASGGGGGGGGGIVAIIHTGDIVNQGSVTAYGGLGGAVANSAYTTYPGNDGSVGTVLIKSISELLAS